MTSNTHSSITAAVEAHRRGWQAVPIRDGGKRPYGSGWPHLRWDNEATITSSFTKWVEEGASGVGLLLGEPSGNLVDIDLDHTTAWRLRDHFLPPTPMQHGRPGNPRSHRWYIAQEHMPSTRRYKMPDGSVSVELRGDGSQTVIPPSTWYPKNYPKNPVTEPYRWEGLPWGGENGPARVDGYKLAIQVALLGMGSVLLDAWPEAGGRHDAYLALAGGLLRYGEGVHPYWERNLPALISALADASHDDDGPDERVSEVMGSTLSRLRSGNKVVGFPRLAEIIGVDHAELTRRMAREVESLGWLNKPATTPLTVEGEDEETAPLVSTLPPEERNPMAERVNSWSAVDLEPYLAGEVVMPEPSVLMREDGKFLFYPGRVNSIFGLSESGKTWVAISACVQEMDRGERAVYLDFEDEPAGTLSRLRALGAGDDDIKNQFSYVHPEGPLSDMQRYRFGPNITPEGEQASSVFRHLLETVDPTIIIADGMTSLYGLHGHDTNEATATDVITSWLKTLTRNGRTTVIVIDHTGKAGGPKSSPIGAHHKIAMVQGSAFRVDAVDRPMPGGVGRMRLIVYKDRPGAVRQISTKDAEQVAAEVEIDSRVPGVTKMTMKVPKGGETVIGEGPGHEEELARLGRIAELKDQILWLFGGDVDLEMTTQEMVDATQGRPKEVIEARKALIETRDLVQHGQNRWTRFHLPRPDPRVVEEKQDEKKEQK